MNHYDPGVVQVSIQLPLGKTVKQCEMIQEVLSSPGISRLFSPKQGMEHG